MADGDMAVHAGRKIGAKYKGPPHSRGPLSDPNQEAYLDEAE